MSYRVQLKLEDVSSAGSLAAWLGRQGVPASFVVAEGSMGASNVLWSTIAGTAGLRAFVVITQEWIRAHRTKLSMQLDGHGKFEVEGTTDVDKLIELLERSAQEATRDDA